MLKRSTFLRRPVGKEMLPNRPRTRSGSMSQMPEADMPTLRVARRWGYSGKTMIAIALATRAGADRG
jgi:hypothetical protein